MAAGSVKRVTPEGTEPIAEEHPHGGDWLRDIVLGLNDGLVTTLVFVMTFSSATDHRQIVLVSALAEMFAGGISMGFGGFLAAQAEAEVRAKRTATERHEIEHEPEEERSELRAIYRGKGFNGPLLDQIVAHQTATPERWLAAMLHDEHGMTVAEPPAPLRSGITVGMAFVVGAIVPVLPFLFGESTLVAKGLSLVAAAAAAIGLGALKSRHTLKTALRSGLEFLLIALLGTGFGLLIGRLLHP